MSQINEYDDDDGPVLRQQIIFSEIMWQQCGKSMTIVLQINSVYSVSNIIEISERLYKLRTVQ